MKVYLAKVYHLNKDKTCCSCQQGLFVCWWWCCENTECLWELCGFSALSAAVLVFKKRKSMKTQELGGFPGSSCRLVLPLSCNLKTGAWQALNLCPSVATLQFKAHHDHVQLLSPV